MPTFLCRATYSFRAEYLLRIVHNVISGSNVRLGSLKRVLSHPVALDQCRDFFDGIPILSLFRFTTRLAA